MKPDLYSDMGITPEDRMLENVNKMFGLLRPNIPARVTLNDLPIDDDLELCDECGDAFDREEMESVDENDTRYVCSRCMYHITARP